MRAAANWNVQLMRVRSCGLWKKLPTAMIGAKVCKPMCTYPSFLLLPLMIFLLITYNSLVQTRMSNIRFINEWRVYLEMKIKLWKQLANYSLLELQQSFEENMSTCWKRIIALHLSIMNVCANLSCTPVSPSLPARFPSLPFTIVYGILFFAKGTKLVTCVSYLFFLISSPCICLET